MMINADMTEKTKTAIDIIFAAVLLNPSILCVNYMFVYRKID